MQIHLAEHRGFCYGVKRAIETVERCIDSGGKAHTLGPIIHNPQMVSELAKKGVSPAKDLDEIAEGTVIIRSHGVGPQIYQDAEAKNLTVVDATCPHVKKAQQAAYELMKEGYPVIIIGERDHPEVKSIVSWTHEQAVIVESIDDAERLPFQQRLGVVVQTTFSGELFEQILAIVKQKCTDIQVKRTICTATDLRQQAAAALAVKMDSMVIIGGKNSANTARLAEVCRQSGCPVYHIETADELKPEWFSNDLHVGVSAGASTPEWIIEEVVHRMEQFNQSLTDSVNQLTKGSIIKGKVVSVRQDEVYVDIGYKAEGIIALSELAYPVPANAAEIVTKDQEIDVYVLDTDSADDTVRLSKVQADKIITWSKLEAAAKEETTLECKVTEVVKGGLVVSINGIRGFIPASQAALRFVDDLASFIGQTLTVIPIELDEQKQRVVLSHRKVLQEEQQKKEQAIFAKLKVGDVVPGVVRRLVDFGAFVDIGGVEGLIHISDLAWQRVKTPSEILQIDDKIEVFVLKLDPQLKKISLSLKQIQQDPWLEQIKSFSEGQIVAGTVVKTTKFGAFVKLANGVEGLVHLSELADRRVATAEEVVQAGQDINVKILGIDKDNKRISLSLIKALEEAERAEYQDYLGVQSGSGTTIGDKLGHLFGRKQ
ncbi:bifunctional 4-hydroxy-3-methylbut-2-enyl diphosphate reductase/30S ribosomal protein S1 [Anaerospora sp.]|uniref:bifunctional 4-hydroxy-3-methylbut-2-enyl diphosphate reductase/30S ribosomal protein S1 n=1 Tax=Anaerospora sp. TaxID=1960278 RepID=UPI00289BF969|nr:bifunctional 4-hydroxy-3-methylbut-2-enyl diphosphate reductase/30S ribosomal protein S1 [Anaerospora sp.]